MKFALDARLINQTGVGRYIRAILSEIKREAAKSPEHEFYILIGTSEKPQIVGYPQNVKIIESKSKWHSLKEQFEIPHLLRKNKIDLVHFPYFNVPIFTTTKFIVTIHDLTINKFNTGKASSLPILIYIIKKIAYLLVMLFAVKKSMLILTVSKTVMADIEKTYGIEKEKIRVVYNGKELEESEEDTRRLEEIKKEKDAVDFLKTKYILYVGNLHPHKNVETLILAFDLLLKENGFDEYKLLIVSPRDFFYQRSLQFIKKLKLEKNIYFTGPIENSKLFFLYKNASVFVFPSFSEGFGIPGVEAMSVGCPVVASDIPVFHEIYGDAVIYFQTKNAVDLKDKIILAISNTNLRSKMYLSGLEQAKKYSWEKSSKEIFEIYENCLRLRSRE